MNEKSTFSEDRSLPIRYLAHTDILKTCEIHAHLSSYLAPVTIRRGKEMAWGEERFGLKFDGSECYNAG